MKRFVFAVALFAALVVSAVDLPLLRYAPDATVCVVQVDVTRMLKHPDVVKTLNEPENLKTRLEFEKMTGVRVEDFKKVVLFIKSSGEALVLVNVDDKFNIEQVFAKNKVAFSKIDTKGGSVLRLAEAGRRGKKVEIFSAAPGVILCGEEGDMVSYLGQPRGKAEAVAAVVGQIPEDPPVWLAFANLFKNPQGKIDDPRQLYLTFRFSGPKKNDLDFKIKLFCGDAEGAQLLSGTIPMYLNMGIALAVNDPALGKEIVSCVKIKVVEKDVLIDMYIPEALSVKMADYFKNNADRLFKQGTDQPGEDAAAKPGTAPAAKQAAPAAKQAAPAAKQAAPAAKQAAPAAGKPAAEGQAK